MPTPLPPTLRRKLREYRFAYHSLALAETLCLGALLAAFLDPAWVWLALAWSGWKFWRRPTPRQIGAALERQQPPLREKLTAALELAASPDPVAVKGSPELLGQLLADVDRQAAAIAVSRLFSLKPVAGLLLAAIIANFAFAHHRAPPHHPPTSPRTRLPPAPSAPSPPVTPPPPAGAPVTLLSAAARLEQLRQIAAALQSLPDKLQRALPPEQRSLAAAVTAAGQADRAAAAGDTTQARALEQSVAETLAEFARVARLTRPLTTLADAADALAAQFARAATRSAPLASGLASSASPNTVSPAPVVLPPRNVAALPPAPVGPAWHAPVAVLRELDAGRLESYPPGYEPRIQEYFQRLAKQPR